MPVTEPDAVKFSNEKVRPLADSMARLFYHAQLVQDEWNATGISSKFPTGKGKVVDGSDTDGRTSITADDVLLLMTRVNEVIADWTANSRAKLNTILKPAVNTRA